MSGDEILLVISLLLSAFFSGSETAFTVAGRLAMEVYDRHGRRGARCASRLTRNPTLLFNTTLVGNNLVGVIYASVAAIWLNDMLPRIGVSPAWIFIISPAIVLVFGEILPKTFARELAERWALLVGGPLWLARWLFAPLIMITRASSGGLLRLFGMRDDEGEIQAISLGDLTGVWGDLHREGTLATEEKLLLDHAIALRDLKIGDIMTPRPEVVALPIEAPVAEAEDTVRKRGFTRLPIFDGHIDNIIGVLPAQALLAQPASLREALRRPLVVPEQAHATRFLTEFRQGRVGLAVVIDEHGGTAGVVTLEDFIEQLVGAIEDEHDPTALTGRMVSTTSWLVYGRAPIPALNERWNLRLPEGDYDTVAGLILSHLDHIPAQGETVDLPGYRLRVAAADARRIKRVLIRLTRPAPRRVVAAVR